MKLLQLQVTKFKKYKLQDPKVRFCISSNCFEPDFWVPGFVLLIFFYLCRCLCIYLNKVDVFEIATLLSQCSTEGQYILQKQKFFNTWPSALAAEVLIFIIGLRVFFINVLKDRP